MLCPCIRIVCNNRLDRLDIYKKLISEIYLEYVEDSVVKSNHLLDQFYVSLFDRNSHPKI